MTREDSNPVESTTTDRRDYLRILLALAGVGALSTSATEVAQAAHKSEAPYPSGAWGYAGTAGHGESERPSIAELEAAWNETYHVLHQDVDVGARYYAEKNDSKWDLLPIVWDGLDIPQDDELPAAGTMVSQSENTNEFRLLGIDDDASHKRIATVDWVETVIGAATTLTWGSTADWDANQSETGVHHEQPAGTDWAAADVLEKGYPSFDESDGSLRNYYPNDNNTGTTSTDVAGSDNGTVNGASWNTGGIFNTPYLGFDGVDDYVDVGTMGTYGSNLQPITISFWIKTTSTSQESVIGTFNDGSNTSFQLQINSDNGSESSGKLFWFIRDEQNEADRYSTTNDIGFNDGSWHHIALVYGQGSSPETTMYMDGSSVSVTQNQSQPAGNTTDFQYSVVYGARNVRGSIDQHLTGDLDELRLYQRELTSSQVTDLYNAVNNESDHWTSKKTGPASQSTITVTTNTTIPAGTSIDITLFQDTDNDGTGPNTDALGNSYDNSATANLTAGNAQTVDLNGFDDDGSDSAYWFHIEPDVTNNDPTTDSPTMSEISAEV